MSGPRIPCPLKARDSLIPSWIRLQVWVPCSLDLGHRGPCAVTPQARKPPIDHIKREAMERVAAEAREAGIDLSLSTLRWIEERTREIEQDLYSQAMEATR